MQECAFAKVNVDKMFYDNFHQAVVREVHNISIQVFAIRYYIVVVGKILHSGGGEDIT